VSVCQCCSIERKYLPYLLRCSSSGAGSEPGHGEMLTCTTREVRSSCPFTLKPFSRNDLPSLVGASSRDHPSASSRFAPVFDTESYQRVTLICGDSIARFKTVNLL